ncbi:MAG: signal peptide peptidase SppA [Planctomycetales bacterium]|nr:signal peptide peptidase SppA [Planctomycetales bacterium]
MRHFVAFQRFASVLAVALLIVCETGSTLCANESAKESGKEAADTGTAAVEAAPARQSAESTSKPSATETSEKPASKSQTAKPRDKSPEEPKKLAHLAEIRIRGSLPEAPAQPGLFGELEQDLAKVIMLMDRAAADEKVDGLLLRIDSPEVGQGKVAELRAAIARVREKKRVYAMLDQGSAPAFLVACACDEIVMPPSGVIMLPGVRAEVSFYKGLFEKLGVEADMLHVGEAKGAAEPYTRTKLSPAVRENLTELLDDVYQQMTQTIAEDRRLSPKRVKQLIDEGLFPVLKAEKYGLVDRVAYEDQWRAGLAKRLGVKDVAIDSRYGKKKIDTDFSGPMGMVKLMQMMLGGETSASAANGKKLAVVYAVGPIMTGKSQQGMFGDSTMGSETIVKALRKASGDDNVVAIVLRVDSPGGSALASDLIWREVVRTKKPVVASMGDVAASGGYYISMGAQRIFAEPATVTGSIGVVGGKVALKGLYEKVGVTTEVISRGKNSGIFSDTAKFSDSERETFLAMMRETYKQFTTKAAKGRQMELGELEKLAGGRVYTGVRAKELGLVDEIGTLRDAIAAAKSLAGVRGEEKVRLEILPEPKSFFEELFGMDDEEAALRTPRLPVGKHLARTLGEVELLERLFREPSLTLMPYRLELRFQ